jgi:hypothetical protein
MSERTKFLLSGLIIGIISHSLTSNPIDKVQVKRSLKVGYSFWQTHSKFFKANRRKERRRFLFERSLKEYGGIL